MLYEFTNSDGYPVLVASDRIATVASDTDEIHAHLMVDCGDCHIKVNVKETFSEIKLRLERVVMPK